MAQIRATFFMRNQRGYGWSETLFSTRANLVEVMADAILLFPKRVNCNGNDVNLYWIRVSDDEIKRDSLVYPVPEGNQQSKNRDLGDSEDANTCLDVQLKAGLLHRRFIYMRGIPDNCITVGGAFTPTPAFTPNFGIWGAALTAGPWGLKYLNTVNAQVNIAGMVQDGTTGFVTVTTAAAHGLVAGDYVNVTGIQGATRARGVHRVLSAPTATTFTYKIKLIMQPYVAFGQTRKVATTVESFNFAQPLRVSRRDTGAPFDRPRGRRRVL